MAVARPIPWAAPVKSVIGLAFIVAALASLAG